MTSALHGWQIHCAVWQIINSMFSLICEGSYVQVGRNSQVKIGKRKANKLLKEKQRKYMLLVCPPFCLSPTDVCMFQTDLSYFVVFGIYFIYYLCKITKAGGVKGGVGQKGQQGEREEKREKISTDRKRKPRTSFFPKQRLHKEREGDV